MRKPRARGNSGNTSVDSMMEDTPANYNQQNQRVEGDDANARGRGGNKSRGKNQDLGGSG
jgi:hypothetical protein